MSLGDVLDSVNNLVHQSKFIGVDSVEDYAGVDTAHYDNGIWVRFFSFLLLGGTYTLSFAEGNTETFGQSQPIDASRIRIQQIAKKAGFDPLVIDNTQQTTFNFQGKQLSHIVAVAPGATPKRFLFPVVTATAIGGGESANIFVSTWGIAEHTPLDVGVLTDSF